MRRSDFNVLHQESDILPLIYNDLSVQREKRLNIHGKNISTFYSE